MAPKPSAELRLFQPNSSCKKPITGVPIAKDEVTPAKNNNPNQAIPAITAKVPPHC